MLQSVGKPGSAFFGTTRPLRTRQHRSAPASRGLAVQVGAAGVTRRGAVGACNWGCLANCHAAQARWPC